MARKKTGAETLAFMHPDIPFDESSLVEEGQRAQKGSQTDHSAQLAELTASIKRLEEANQGLQRTNMALMGTSLTPQQPQFGPTEVDLEGLPDPVTDPKAYAAAIVQRGDAVLQARQKASEWQSGQQKTLQERVDGIWSQFNEAYKGYAGNPDLVEAAATKAMQKAKAQGIDPNKYMFAATPQFFADTVKVLEGWGIKGQTEEKEDEQEEPLRTSGIPGGLESSGKLTTGKDPDEVRIPSLMDELKDWKLKTGFYA